MSDEEKIESFVFSYNPYEKEARKLWGDIAVDEANAKIKKLSKLEQKEFAERFNAIYKNLARHRHLLADSKEAQAAIETWYMFLNEMGNYSFEAFRNLGQMYVDDQRFTENIDKFGPGLAKFMCEAMAVYADANQQKNNNSAI